MFQHVTFNDMAGRHGKLPALKLLRAIEAKAQITNEIISIDLDARFEKAFKALCDINFAV